MANRSSSEHGNAGWRVAGQVNDLDVDGGFVRVEHVYRVDENDPGEIAIIVHDHANGDEECTEAIQVLQADEALALAHFLTRAAEWVFDAAVGDPPDVEREAARLHAPTAFQHRRPEES